MGHPLSFSALARWVLVLACLISTGCSTKVWLHPVYNTTGFVLTAYARDEATPYVFAMDDPEQTCITGNALDPLVYSFKLVGHEPLKTGSLMMLLAANCSAAKAWEEELRAIRAEREGDIEEAKDARTAQERWLAVTAKRRLLVFERAMKAYGFDPGAEELECPDFDIDQDELTFLLGLLTGLQAVVNDSKAGSIVGVPKNIAPEAARASRCVRNEKWAGTPQALRASVWLLLPDLHPVDAPDPWTLLDQAQAMGMEQGFRLPAALRAVMAESLGNEKQLAEALKALTPDEDFESSEAYELADVTATREIRAVSDRYWTRNYGERTPSMYLGKLKKPKPNLEVEGIDDLL